MKNVISEHALFTECGCQFEKGSWITAVCEHGREFVQRDPSGGHWSLIEVTERPTVVCLCGSTRFSEAFQKANYSLTLSGKIVLTIGCDTKDDNDLFSKMSLDKGADLKSRLDILHFRKIDLADEVLILNVDGYIGRSTARALAYAKSRGKLIRYYEPGL